MTLLLIAIVHKVCLRLLVPMPPVLTVLCVAQIHALQVNRLPDRKAPGSPEGIEWRRRSYRSPGTNSGLLSAIRGNDLPRRTKGKARHIRRRLLTLASLR
jgi:hypothetical protein